MQYNEIKTKFNAVPTWEALITQAPILFTLRLSNLISKFRSITIFVVF
jgi:hypothetical protein